MRATRALVVLSLAAGLAAGCGGGRSGAPATSSPAVPVDPGAAVVADFAAAARADDAGKLWALLSTESQRRLGGTLARFRQGPGVRAAAEAGGFRRYRVIVSERITPEFGVVGIDGERLGRAGSTGAVAAFVLRRERSRWHIELAGPVHLRPLGPDPSGPREVVTQVAAAVSGPGGAGTAVMYVDGRTASPQVAGTAANATLYAGLAQPLTAGRHTVVAFASDGQEAGATAWAFVALGAKGG